MKVLYVIPGLGIGGGAERSLLDLAPRLAAEGIELEIVYFHDRPSSALLRFEELGIPVQQLAAHGWFGRWRELRRLIGHRRPDVVHTTLFPADILGRLAAWRTGTLVLTSLVSTNYEPERRLDPTYSRVRVAVVRTIESLTIRWLCDRVHANSVAVKNSAIRRLHVDPSRITVVHRGRDLGTMRPRDPALRAATRAAVGLTDADDLVLMIGRHEYQKGHLSALRALTALVVDRPTAVLVVAGREGTMTSPIREAIAAAGLERSVRLLGHRGDVADLLAAADVLLLPSIIEGLPGVLIEAMASGVPIVASAIPPVAELLDDQSAVLVAPGDALGLAQGLRGVLEDPATAAELGQAGRRRFEQRFTVDHALAGMTALYREMVAE